MSEALPAEMQGKTREIISVQSEAQGRGHATALLWSTCREADVDAIVLIIRPLPFADGLDMLRLLKFYSRFNFVPIQQAPCVLLARQPERVVRMARG